jgi:hypothetical protein
MTNINQGQPAQNFPANTQRPQANPLVPQNPKLSKRAIQSLNWRQFLTGEQVKMGKESLLDRVVKLVVKQAVMQSRSEN